MLYIESRVSGNPWNKGQLVGQRSVEKASGFVTHALIMDTWIFSGGGSLVTDVMTRGQWRVRGDDT